jgi:diphthine-ammonia ligase
MKFVALVSGGKDSIYCILECIRNGHELVACVHLGAPADTDEESYMYQTAASETLHCLVEECLGVPLLLYQRVGKSVNTSLVYQESSQDEVEDLFLALKQAQAQFGVDAVCSGAILSTYQRVRIEHVCSRLGMTSLSYLWRLGPQTELLGQMLDDGIVAVIVQAACPPGLIPRRHLNQTLNSLNDSGLFQRLHDRYQFHMCGEGGEYESLVVDSPLYKKKLILDEVEIVEADDGVGSLKILKCHAEDKGEGDVPILDMSISTTTRTVESLSAPSKNATGTDEPVTQSLTNIPSITYMPRVQKGTGGFLYVSEIIAPVAAFSPTDTEAQLAVHEALQLFSMLQKVLQAYGATAQDVMMVHLYLSEMSHFSTINAHYRNFFGTLLPPSRSCVAVGRHVLPGGRRVLLDCMIQCGSGQYMRADSEETLTDPLARAAFLTKTSKLRQVLHVQSISHWAPVCVGPYSQVNTLRSGLHFLAGQIGLVPSTMKLRETWTDQLEQCWKNVACVLDALEGGSLEHLVSGLIYASDEVYKQQGALNRIESISKQFIQENGGILPGRIDAAQYDPYDGYEDEDTWLEMKKEQEQNVAVCPLLIVSIPEMPFGAAVEVEVIAATHSAASNLKIGKDAMISQPCTTKDTTTAPDGWDSGHDFPETNQGFNENIQVDASSRVLGRGCAAAVIVTASTDTTTKALDVQLGALLGDMLLAVDKVLAEGRSGLKAANTVHVRLYHVATEQSSSGEIKVKDDGVGLRSSLQSSIASWRKNEESLPASTLVPVQGMKLITAKSNTKDMVTMMAMQVLVVDPVHMETEIWINKGRENP